MHYNPSSIALAQQTVDYEAEQNGVRAVLVESCPTRWNATLDAQPPGSLLRSLCDNEMQAAAEAGQQFGIEVDLGDQTIEDTGSRAAQLLALTLAEALQRFGAADAVPGEEVDEEAPKRLKSRVSLCPALYGLPTIKMK